MQEPSLVDCWRTCSTGMSSKAASLVDWVHGWSPANPPMPTPGLPKPKLQHLQWPVKSSGASSKKTTSCKGCLLVACKSWSIPCHRRSILFLQRVHQFLWEPVRFHRMALCVGQTCTAYQSKPLSEVLRLQYAPPYCEGVLCLWSQAKHEGRRVHFLGHQCTLRLHAFTKASSYCCFQSFFSSRRRG